MLKPILAISLGAALGAVLRWMLGSKLNSLFPAIPPGTLTANVVGGYIVGVAIAYFAQAPEIAPEWRLLIVTGFCGGLTVPARIVWTRFCNSGRLFHGISLTGFEG
jgi:CrcB protein